MGSISTDFAMTYAGRVLCVLYLVDVTFLLVYLPWIFITNSCAEAYDDIVGINVNCTDNVLMHSTNYLQQNSTIDDVLECNFKVTCTDNVSIHFSDYRQHNLTDGVLECNFHCFSNCRCSLAAFCAVQNCTNSVVASQQVKYPAKLSYLSWADSGICDINVGAFTGLNESLIVLNLTGNKLQVIISGQFQTLRNLVILELQRNALKELMPFSFKGLSNLEALNLRENVLTSLQPDLFNGLVNLAVLYLDGNRITKLGISPFEKLPSLLELSLNNNLLTEIQQSDFNGLKDLRHLYLKYNKLARMEVNVFAKLKSLVGLHLGYNLLETIQKGLFDDLSNLQHLSLRNNSFTFLHPMSLWKLQNLDMLDLSYNKLAHLPPNLLKNSTKVHTLLLGFMEIQTLPENFFTELSLLQFIELTNNRLTKLSSSMFRNCSKLRNIDMINNPLRWIEPDAFVGISNQTSVFFTNAGSCCFAYRHVGKCHSAVPKSSFLTCNRLLHYRILRIGIWAICILAIVANIMVHFFGCKDEHVINKVQFLFIRNLSVSDFLMGVYLIILLSVDMYYTDYFPSHSDSWRNGTLCKIAGFLSVLSSEASVLFITLISIDRFLKVKYPLFGRRLGTKVARVLVCSIWLVALGISIISVVLSSLGNSDIYAASEVCVGLPLSRHYHHEKNKTSIPLPFGFKAPVIINEQRGKKMAMYFPIAIFTVLNLVCFFIVGVCYSTIFIFVRQSSMKSGLGSISKNEIRMAKKVFLIVFTDFCCWVPIGILSILVQAGAVEVHPVAYAWIATFILPINASINPFLYTLGDVIIDKFKSSCCKKQNGEDNIDLKRYSAPKTLKPCTATTKLDPSRSKL